MLFGKQGRGDLIVRGAHVIDTASGVDAALDVRVDGGTIAQLGTSLDANEHRVVDGTGLVLAPADKNEGRGTFVYQLQPGG